MDGLSLIMMKVWDDEMGVWLEKCKFLVSIVGSSSQQTIAKLNCEWFIKFWIIILNRLSGSEWFVVIIDDTQRQLSTRENHGSYGVIVTNSGWQWFVMVNNGVSGDLKIKPPTLNERMESICSSGCQLVSWYGSRMSSARFFHAGPLVCWTYSWVNPDTRCQHEWSSMNTRY